MIIYLIIGLITLIIALWEGFDIYIKSINGWWWRKDNGREIIENLDFLITDFTFITHWRTFFLIAVI
jgi:hypothetical protein